MLVYKSFPKSSLIKNWKELIFMKESEVIKLYKEWEQIEEENLNKRKILYNEKIEKLNEITNYMESIGIEVFKYKGNGFSRKKNGYLSWFEKNVVEKISVDYPEYRLSIPTAHMGSGEVNGIELYNNQSPTNLVELYKRIKSQYSQKMKETNNETRNLIKCIEYATKNNIEILDLTEKEIINIVTEAAKDEYLLYEYPEGSKVELSNECSECNEYIVGDRRCSCGNRRISMEIEGNLVDGFYCYPEAY